MYCNVLAFDPNTNVDEWTFSWSPADEVSDPTAQSVTIAPETTTVYSVEMVAQMARYIWMKSPSRCIRCLVSSPTPKWPCVQRSEDNWKLPWTSPMQWTGNGSRRRD